jgi:hypothetical protein
MPHVPTRFGVLLVFNSVNSDACPHPTTPARPSRTRAHPSPKLSPGSAQVVNYVAPGAAGASGAATSMTLMAESKPGQVASPGRVCH